MNETKYFISEVTVANRPEKKLGQFYSKRKLDIKELSNVVYQLDCPDWVYENNSIRIQYQRLMY